MIADYSCFTISLVAVLFNDETWQVNYRAKPVSLDIQTLFTMSSNRLPLAASCLNLGTEFGSFKTLLKLQARLS